MAFVLDASALLAYWLDELGAEVVTMAVSAEGAFVAPPNFAEALTSSSTAVQIWLRSCPLSLRSLQLRRPLLSPGSRWQEVPFPSSRSPLRSPTLRQAPTGYEAFGVGTGGQSMLGARSVPGSAGAHR